MPQPSSSARNVVLITIDSLRADHVGAYGDPGARTPVLNALASGGVRFDRAYTTAPLTLPAHASLMTGRYPPHHGARHDGSHVDDGVPRLAALFQHLGFATAAFAGASALDPRRGLDRGFETYEVAAGRPGRIAVNSAAAWLETHKERRFFLWVHIVDPHAPYGDPDDRARVARPAVDRYDDDVTEADTQAGRLLAALGPRRAETLVVVTADYGEAFSEHGEITHGLFVYDTTLRVPLILNGVSLERGRVVTDPVSLVDVAPTIASLAGLPRFDSDGQDLAISGSQPPTAVSRALYAESFAPLVDFGWSPLRSLRRGDWKYIAAPHPELYDLKTDPGETRNLIDDQPARGAELAREVDAISPDSLPGVTEAAAARPDPKDRRTIAARLAEVTSGELRGPLLERALREIVRDDPGNALANLRLGQVLATSNRCTEAVRRFNAAIAAHAPGDEAQRGLARCKAGASRVPNSGR